MLQSMPPTVAAVNVPSSARLETRGQSPENWIEIRNLSKTFKTRNGTTKALTAVNLDIRKGEFVSVIGPSGCGKSTLMMLLAGLDKASGGTIQVGDKFIKGPNSDIGVVFQQDVLLEWRNTLANVMLQAEIRKLDIPSHKARAEELLKMVGLERFHGAFPHELSGGMRQRVSICRGLLHNPPLLVMDEPFGALDALTREQLQIDLLKLWWKMNMTVVFITHSISEAVFMSDRIVVMSPRPGRIEKIIDVDLPRPRRLKARETPEFAHYVQEVQDIFKTLGVLNDEEE